MASQTRSGTASPRQPDVESGRAPFLEVKELRKSFNGVRALDGVSFAVWQGELFGFLGPNGAGKTTTINILTGLARPDSGSIFVGGVDCTSNPKAAQHLIGIVPDESNLYPELTGLENLCFSGALYGMRRHDRQMRALELLDAFGLSDAADHKFAGYSRGMKRKLTIAAGIIHQPSILFLDEPTTGIDVASARQIRQLIAELHRGGTTIFLTTHYIEEAERLCDRIAFIVRGQIVRIATLAALLQPVHERHVMLLSVPSLPEDFMGALESTFPALTFDALAGNNQIRIESDAPIRVGPLVRFFEERGIDVTEARRIQPSLEDVFVQITGIEADALRREKEKTGGSV